MSDIYIGIDNGVSGSIGIITPEASYFYLSPVFKQLNYTKEKKWINRLDTKKFRAILTTYVTDPTKVLIGLERPMVNPGRFAATISAVRCLEASLLVIEDMKLPYEYLDSKAWQKMMLPSGLEKEELKVASLDIGKRKFPHLAELFKKDADSILMALYLKQRENKEL